eukprot:GCRY01003589.1.p1 GENE.GCRY01003589.1~~GCRY01003589.1.p1  ORF type:complete len:166 (-),score=24.23 GCRY01003589.1:75-572(-)
MLNNHVCIVTGGTTGIGAAIVQELVEKGGTVYFTGRPRHSGFLPDFYQAPSMQDAISTQRLHYCPCDHTKAEDSRSFVKKVLQDQSRIDVLVNNAGIVLQGNIETTTEEEWDECFDINVKAVFRMCRLVLPHMVKQRAGSVVNIASDWVWCSPYPKERKTTSLVN